MVDFSGTIRKVGAAVYAVLFLFGQFHMCQTAYELPSGAECAVCPTLEHEEGPTSHDAQLTAKHNDCHDCCTIGACEEPKQQTSSLAPTAFQLLAHVNLPAQIHISIPEPPTGTLSHPWQIGAPPTGPPKATSARAPPRLA